MTEGLGAWAAVEAGLCAAAVGAAALDAPSQVQAGAVPRAESFARSVVSVRTAAAKVLPAVLANLLPGGVMGEPAGCAAEFCLGLGGWPAKLNATLGAGFDYWRFDVHKALS